ncbi:hypothetical protein D3C76_1084510 [compost metagenome]
MKVIDFFAAGPPVNACQGFVTVRSGIHIQASQPTLHFLKQAQPLPVKQHPPTRLWIVPLVNLLADPPPQRVIGKHHPLTLATAVLLHANQPLLGVILEILHPIATDPLLAQPPKAVVAIAFVLIHQHPVVLDQAIELGAVEQVTGLVVLEILDLRGLPVGA